MRLFPALRANSIPGAYPQRRRWVATRASASTAEITEKKQKVMESLTVFALTLQCLCSCRFLTIRSKGSERLATVKLVDLQDALSDLPCT